ncbi:MAG TPA: hypothetical protein VKZ96_13530 [Thermomicrobiales bacterium]|nr:hypothetical protein [Thermomicrobiales bacterium]
MSFWVGLVIIVLFLEVVRIGLSSFLLLHILRGIQPGQRVGEETSARANMNWTRERDRLAAEAMAALRQAMDGRAGPGSDRVIAPAIDALDAYVLHHVNQGRG